MAKKITFKQVAAGMKLHFEVKPEGCPPYMRRVDVKRVVSQTAKYLEIETVNHGYLFWNDQKNTHMFA